MDSSDDGVVDLFALDRDDQIESIRNQLRTAIETYPRDWRLVQEPLQNAIDSFFEPTTSSYVPPSDGGEPTVEVTLDIDSNFVSIKDNGLGIPADQFKVLFYPYYTKKRRDGDRSYRRVLKGSQGIGLKASIFSSELFELHTVHEGTKWDFSRSNLCSYDSPSFDSRFVKPDAVRTTDPSGTLVKIRLKDFSVPDFVRERVNEFATRLQLAASTDGTSFTYGSQIFKPRLERILWHYFLTQTYAGDLSRYLGVEPPLPKINLVLHVVCERGLTIPGVETISSASTSSSIGYFNAKTAYETTFRPRDKATTPFVDEPWYNLIERDRSLEGSIYETHIFGEDEVAKLLGSFVKSQVGRSNPYQFVPPDRNKRQSHQVALSRVNGVKIVIARAETLRWRLGIPTEQLISVNGLVTDIPLTLGRVGNTGYRSSTHIIIDIDATLGVGKRNLGGNLTVHGKTRDTINQFFTEIWRNVAKLAQLITKEPDEGVQGVTNDFTVQDLSITLNKTDQQRMKEEFGRVTIPESEQDVLQAHQYWTGRRNKPLGWVRLHTQRRYDGVFGPGSNRLIVEYKVNPEDLARNDSDATHPQKLRDIDVAITWLRPSQDRMPENYRIKTKDEETREWRNRYPDEALFPPSAMYRLYRQPDSEENLDSVFLLSLQDIWEGLPHPLAQAQSRPESSSAAPFQPRTS